MTEHKPPHPRAMALNRLQDAARDEMREISRLKRAEEADEKARDVRGTLGPTAQTKAKLKADVILKLHRAGALRKHHVRAAEEIRDVWEWIGRGLYPQRPEAEDGVRVSSRRVPRAPLERMTNRQFEVYRDHYCPWARQMGVPVRRGRRLTRLELVFLIVCDNYGPRQVERMFGLSVGHRVATKALHDALEAYAKIAGFAGVAAPALT